MPRDTLEDVLKELERAEAMLNGIYVKKEHSEEFQSIVSKSFAELQRMSHEDPDFSTNITQNFLKVTEGYYSSQSQSRAASAFFRVFSIFSKSNACIAPELADQIVMGLVKAGNINSSTVGILRYDLAPFYPGGMREATFKMLKFSTVENALSFITHDLNRSGEDEWIRQTFNSEAKLDIQRVKELLPTILQLKVSPSGDKLESWRLIKRILTQIAKGYPELIDQIKIDELFKKQGATDDDLRANFLLEYILLSAFYNPTNTIVDDNPKLNHQDRTNISQTEFFTTIQRARYAGVDLSSWQSYWGSVLGYAGNPTGLFEAAKLIWPKEIKTKLDLFDFLQSKSAWPWSFYVEDKDFWLDITPEKLIQALRAATQKTSLELKGKYVEQAIELILYGEKDFSNNQIRQIVELMYKHDYLALFVRIVEPKFYPKLNIELLSKFAVAISELVMQSPQAKRYNTDLAENFLRRISNESEGEWTDESRKNILKFISNVYGDVDDEVVKDLLKKMESRFGADQKDLSECRDNIKLISTLNRLAQDRHPSTFLSNQPTTASSATEQFKQKINAIFSKIVESDIDIPADRRAEILQVIQQNFVDNKYTKEGLGIIKTELPITWAKLQSNVADARTEVLQPGSRRPSLI